MDKVLRFAPAMPLVGYAFFCYSYYTGVLLNYTLTPYGAIIATLAHIFMIFSFICFLYCVLKHPGKLSLDFEPREASNISSPTEIVDIDYSLGTITFCPKCEKCRPPRVHHCSTCNTCILRYDHHCVYIANCVGLYTHKSFILWLLYTAIALGLAGPHMLSYNFEHTFDV